MRILISAFLLICIPFAAHAAECPEMMDAEAFGERLSTSAERVRVTWPEGTFPLGHSMEVVFGHDDDAEDLRYRAWVVRAGSDADPRQLVIGEVARDVGTGETTVQLDLELGAHAPAWSELISPVSFVILACNPDTDQVVFAATGRHYVSSALSGWLAMALAFVVAYLAVAAYAALWPFRRGKDYPRPRHGLKSFFLDFRNRVSLSYVQIFFFFGVIFLAFAYVFGRTFQLSELSEDVLFLLGISAAGGVAGKIADVQRNRLKWENWAWLRYEMDAFPGEEDAKPSWRQLVTTQGQFDIYRFQALCFTFVVAPAVALMSLYRLGELQIPDGVLAVLGLSQVTYVAGKLATQSSVKDFDARIDDVRTRFREGKRLSETEARSFASEFEAALEIAPKPGLVERLRSAPLDRPSDG